MVYSIVVTYNGAKWVDKCFGSLVNSTITNHRIFAIDNGSTDGTVDLISANFPTVEVIETGANLGFGKANNIGMRKALEDNADFVFLLNQDAWVEKDTIEKLAKVSEKNPEYGVLSTMQYKYKNKLEQQFITYLPNNFDEIDAELIELPFVNAASWLLPMKCIKYVGFFDTIFFHYGEDNNYCKRAIFHGFKIGIVRSLNVTHDREISQKQRFSKYESVVKNMLCDINKNPYKSLIRFYLKLPIFIAKSIFDKRGKVLIWWLFLMVKAPFILPSSISSRKRY